MGQQLDPARRAFEALFDQVVTYLPNLLAALLLLAVGWLVSRLLGGAAKRLVRRLNLDDGLDRTGWRETLERARIKLAPSEIVGRMVFWIVQLVFVVLAVENLGFGLTAIPLRSFIAYLPRVVGAVLFLFLGAVVAGFLSKAFGAALSRLEFSQHRALAGVVQGLILLVTFLAVFDHLGFDVGFLSATLGNLLTILAAALALAFVLGSREVARNMLSGYYARERFRAGDRVKLDANVGELQGIGTLTSVVRTAEGDLVFPNHRLVESNVMKINDEHE